MIPEFKTNFEQLFYQALRIRKVEEKIAEIYPSDKVQSPVHLSIGQEHISVGVCAGLTKSDLVFGTYRGHALYLAKGGDLNRMMAELFGKATGCGAGKAGSMHLSDVSVGMMGASAVVASTISHAVGAALGAEIRKSGQVVVCFFGEGATGEGEYHESLNFAAARKLPVLFVCENNDLSIYTTVSSTHAFVVTEHAKVFGIPAKEIESGMDIQLIAEESRGEIEKIRAGQGPRLLEIRTYRYRQHVGPNEDYDVGYRERSELEVWQSKDPLVQRTDLVERFTPSIEQEIQQALQFAEESPFPTSENFLQDVY